MHYIELLGLHSSILEYHVKKHVTFDYKEEEGSSNKRSNFRISLKLSSLVTRTRLKGARTGREKAPRRVPTVFVPDQQRPLKFQNSILPSN